MNNKITMDTKYNIPTIEMFLDIFGLDLQKVNLCEKMDNLQYLKIYSEKEKVGQVSFNKEDIKIQANSKYGTLDGTVNYADCFRLIDMENIDISNKIGLYANWSNTFKFRLYVNNNPQRSFTGDFMFNIKSDNEFGNRLTPHIKIKYQDNDKSYMIYFNENGDFFKFNEKRGDFEEEICYSADTFSNIFIIHSKSDVFFDEKGQYPYNETTLISCNRGLDKKTMYYAVYHKDFNNHWYIHDCQEFPKIQENDMWSDEEFVYRMNYMNKIDPSLNYRLKKMISEFSVDEESFMEKIILYGFTDFNEEAIWAMFGLNKKDINLETMYFDRLLGKNNEKKRVRSQRSSLT